MPSSLTGWAGSTAFTARRSAGSIGPGSDTVFTNSAIRGRGPRAHGTKNIGFAGRSSAASRTSATTPTISDQP